MLKIKKAVNFIFECEFKAIVVLSMFFLFGMIFGAIHSCKMDLPSDVVKSIISDNLMTLCLKNLLILTFAFLLGYTVIGAPLICFIIVYSGISCGLFLGIFSINFGFRGSFVAALCFYLFYFINLISLVFVSFSSIRLSLALYNVFKNNTRYVSPGIYSKPHMIKFSAFAAFTLFSCVYYIYIARGLALILI